MRILRKILLALLLSLLFGFALGTILRLRLERPVWYLAENSLALSARPLDVVDARPCVFDTRHHEQQLG